VGYTNIIFRGLMTVNVSPQNLKRFQAYKDVLNIMKNNGNPSNKKVTQDEVIEFLFSHSPIRKEVEDYMNRTEEFSKKISVKRDELLLKGEAST